MEIADRNPDTSGTDPATTGYAEHQQAQREFFGMVAPTTGSTDWPTP